jgi:hypothetical protein
LTLAVIIPEKNVQSHENCVLERDLGTAKSNTQSVQLELIVVILYLSLQQDSVIFTLINLSYLSF